jgi:hypothetical protein
VRAPEGGKRDIVGSLAGAVAARTSRRGFLAKTALVGTAVAVAPLEYVLKPVSSYAAICGCGNQSCDCGSVCCGGYTEFCCVLTGANQCPPGTKAGGWWKVDGSSFCGSGPRYYLDCHPQCTSCGCGGGGVCSPGCTDVTCRCAFGSCAFHRTGCNIFRYGQCNADIACLGPPQCRIVTCVPPWLIDSTCSMTVHIDGNSAFHDTACLHVPRGVFEAALPVFGGIHVGGWAIDSDYATSIPVVISVDGVAVREVVANVSRPDVAAAVPGWGPLHGFDLVIPVSNGSHTVCVTAVNIGPGSNQLLGCKTVLVGSPFGVLDSVTTTDASIDVTGWVIDPNQGAAPATVAVQVDGVTATTGPANVNRPDVGAAYPPYGPDHGFAVSVPASAGGHGVCALVVGGATPPGWMAIGCSGAHVGAGSTASGPLHAVGPAGSNLPAQWEGRGTP